MASTSNQEESASTSHPSTLPSCQWKYDVFLSFRGEDTRYNFTDHLYAALIQKGIIAFRDEEGLEKGEAIGPKLLKAIEDSTCSIIVFSSNYASSSWCLKELAKAIECMTTKGQHVFPVFYDVDPSDIRKQRGNFEKAFATLEENNQYNAETVKNWRRAMTTAADLKGWDMRDRPQAKMISDIVGVIFGRLKRRSWSADKDLVGLDSHLEKLNIYLNKRSDDVQIIGIHGIGGVGKTTIARIIFDKISYQFEASCFLDNVREAHEKDGLALLQQQLLSQLLGEKNIKIWNAHEGMEIISRLCCKRVLLFLDDVNQAGQLKGLVRERNWVGPGSIIVITSRDEHLLATYGVDELYKMEGLNDEDSLQLFSLNAFKSLRPDDDFLELSKKFVEYASGLPLALEVLGSFLYGRSADEWESALRGRHEISNEGILDRLEISYRGLNNNEKKIFLDVACFFKGMDRKRATKVLDNCGFHAAIGICALIDKSLITLTDKNILWMHDLLQEMGRNIVRRESLDEPGKRSRLCLSEDVRDMLRKKTATDTVETITFDGFENFHVRPDAFMKMNRLRLLEIGNVQLPHGLHFLSNELRLLEWDEYPLNCLPSSFQPDNIVVLNMLKSRIQQPWNGTRILDKLTFINLSHSECLKRIPDLTGAPNLEELILEGCTGLVEVHPSVGLLKRLLILNMKDCKSLWKLPECIEMDSLQAFTLSGCFKLKKFPEIKGKMERLLELLLDGTGIEHLPISIENLGGLVLLNLSDCINLKCLPDSIDGLKSLKTLNLSGCQRLDKLPENMGVLDGLEKLDVSGTAIRVLPTSIACLTNLKVLSCQGCGGPPSTQPVGLFGFFFGRKSSNSLSLSLPRLSGLSSLTDLDLSNCSLCEGMIPSDIGCLSSLERVNLRGNGFVSLPGSISQLCKLETIYLGNCKQLQSLPQLPPNVEVVEMENCTSLEVFPNRVKVCTSEYSAFWLSNCHKLVDNHNGRNFVLTWLKSFLQGLPRSSEGFNVLLPGTAIPEWFTYQSTGSRVMIDLPARLYDDSTFFGFIVCAVFRINRSIDNNVVYGGKYTAILNCKVADPEGTLMNDGFYCLSFDRCSKIRSDHLWFLHLSTRGGYLPEGICKGRSIAFSFEAAEDAKVHGWDVEVKKCGVRLAYEQDVEKLEKTMKGDGGGINSNCVFEELEEDPPNNHHFDTEKPEGEEKILVKRTRSRDAFHDAPAEHNISSSSSSSSNRTSVEEHGGLIKRLKHF